MYTLTINITKDVLKEAMYCGTQGSGLSASSHCGIAVAIRDIFPNALVGLNSFTVDSVAEHLTEISLPMNARKFISNFDWLVLTPSKRLDMEEFSFDITLPDKVIETIDIEEVKQILKDSKILQLHEC